MLPAKHVPAPEGHLVLMMEAAGGVAATMVVMMAAHPSPLLLVLPQQWPLGLPLLPLQLPLQLMVNLGPLPRGLDLRRRTKARSTAGNHLHDLRPRYVRLVPHV